MKNILKEQEKVFSKRFCRKIKDFSEYNRFDWKIIAFNNTSKLISNHIICQISHPLNVKRLYQIKRQIYND